MGDSIEIARRYHGSIARPMWSQRKRQNENSREAELQGSWCRAKKNYQEKLADRSITGAKSVRTSNIRDHAHSDQHMHTMMLWKKERAEAKDLGAALYAPIAQLLQGLSVDEKAKLSKKLDISYFGGTELMYDQPNCLLTN